MIFTKKSINQEKYQFDYSAERKYFQNGRQNAINVQSTIFFLTFV